MNIGARIDRLSETPAFRVVLHAGFWLVYLSWPVYLSVRYMEWQRESVLVQLLLNIMFVASYYFLTYFLIKRYFTNSRWPLFIIYTLALYLALFYSCRAVYLWYLSFCTDPNACQNFQIGADRQPYDLAWIAEILFVTAIPLSLKSVRSFYRLKDKHAELQKLNTDLELNFLRSQINPHFLFNTLNNIYSLALQKSDIAPEMIIRLSDLMRYILYESNAEKTDLEKEVSFMRDYVELEQLRHGKDVMINFTVEGELQGKTTPPLLLIHFVENAFKHGINAQLGSSWVNIVLRAGERDLFFSIENNKPQHPPEKQKTGGIGLENIRKRLLLIYPGKHELSITDEDQHYHVQLTITEL